MVVEAIYLFDPMGRRSSECRILSGYYEVSEATIDVSSRDTVRALIEKAGRLDDVVGLIHAAGVSPSQASPAIILKVGQTAAL